MGDDGLSKRLVHFLISESLIPSLGFHRVWTQCPDILDHFPIFLEWDNKRGSCNYPFKFNHSWLRNPSFNAWFLQRWSSHTTSGSSMGIEAISHKLRKLKEDTKVWIKNKLASIDSDSNSLNQAIGSLLTGLSNGILSLEEMNLLTWLRSEKPRIMDHYLLTWQLKSRTKWTL